MEPRYFRSGGGGPTRTSSVKLCQVLRNIEEVCVCVLPLDLRICRKLIYLLSVTV